MNMFDDLPKVKECKECKCKCPIVETITAPYIWIFKVIKKAIGVK